MSCPVSSASASSGATCPVAHASAPMQTQDKTQHVDEASLAPIPQPPERFLVGNMLDIDPVFRARGFQRLAPIYGPIYKMNLKGTTTVVLSNHAMIQEVSDDKRFDKFIKPPLPELRDFIGDGLFTAHTEEENWGMAHRILVPAFGPIAIKKMFPQMMDIVSQMVLKWDRLGPDQAILASDDFTRMAFDTIGICAFNYRFNQFYADEVHWFAKEMTDVLRSAGQKANTLYIQQLLSGFSEKNFQEKIRDCHKLCDEIVQDRKRNPKPEVNDMLNCMLDLKDPSTGKKLSDENIRYQMATFLVAGHETTSGTMAFMMLNLLDNPECLQKCYQEVDEVVGDNALEASHLPKLKYIEAAIRETLRFLGPITLNIRHCREKETVIGGKYKITSDMPLMVNLMGLHHDTKVWGDDAEKFRPERLMNGGWEALPSHAWQPFGTGARACIGRALAEQEMLIAAALIFQRFIVEKADPDYQLRIMAALTVKPDDFYIKVRRRPGKSLMVGIAGAPSANAAKTSNAQADASGKTATSAQGSEAGHPLAVFYGGNSGTCKSFSEDVITDAQQYGFNGEVKSLDSATEALPTDRPVVIITSSYEGQPPDNAKHFVAWLEANADKKDFLKGVRYAVCGVGNSEWYSTFHRIPKLVDEIMTKMGAERIAPAGYVNVAEDIVGPFDDWKEHMFPKLREATGVKSEVKKQDIQISISKPEHHRVLAGQETSEGTVISNEVLAAKSEINPEKRHMEIRLPAGTEYSTGDYIAILPFNPTHDAQRVLKRFALHPDDHIEVSGTNKAHLAGPSTSVFDLLMTRVELATPASQRQVQQLAELTEGSEKQRLQELASDPHYKTEVLAKRYSIIDLLEDFPSCKLSFGAYLDMLSPLSPRQYSISSSPLTWMPDAAKSDSEQSPIASVTYDVHESPARSGNNRTFRGVATNYMAHLKPGQKVRCFVRSTNMSFHLPPSTETPVIMMATGTGIAPMRGFLQERAAIKAAGGRTLGPASLYFGVRDHEKDFIFKDQLAQWEKEGIVTVRPAFSKNGPEGKVSHITDHIWDDRDALREMFVNGGKIFVCGSASVGRSTADVCKKIWLERHEGKTEADAEEWLRKMREDRYVSDVFG